MSNILEAGETMFPRKYLKPLLSLCSLPAHVDKKEGNSRREVGYKKRTGRCYSKFRSTYVIQAYLSSFKMIKSLFEVTIWKYFALYIFLVLNSIFQNFKIQICIRFRTFLSQSPVNFHPKLYHTLCCFPTVEDIL